MGRPKNSKLSEKELANLKPCKPGETHNPNGRPKRLGNAIKGLPKDMQEKVYGVLAFALTLPDETSAKAYLDQQSGELGKYGFVLQIAIKQLCKEGWLDGSTDSMEEVKGKKNRLGKCSSPLPWGPLQPHLCNGERRLHPTV